MLKRAVLLLLAMNDVVCERKKVKLSLCLIDWAPSHEDTSIWGERRYSPTILNLGTRRRSAVSFAPWPLHPRGKGSRCPLGRRLSGPQSRFGQCGEDKSLESAGNRTPISQAVEYILMNISGVYQIVLLRFHFFNLWIYSRRYFQKAKLRSMSVGWHNEL
jgi:hypothetical protein